MLRVSEVPRKSSSKMDGDLKPQTFPTAFCFPHCLVLGVQVLTSPAELGAVSSDQVEHQD